jgi:hypothetical protein
MFDDKVGPSSEAADNANPTTAESAYMTPQITVLIHVVIAGLTRPLIRSAS